MKNFSPHSFHIPVLGLGFTIDTPIKVARFGISSVLSIVEDEMIERMRQVYSRRYDLEYTPIPRGEDDYRARRITAYLNAVDIIVARQLEVLRALPFEEGNELAKYLNCCPPTPCCTRPTGRCWPSKRDRKRLACRTTCA